MTTERVHLAGDDEDDLYSGFDVNNDIQVSNCSNLLWFREIFISVNTKTH